MQFCVHKALCNAANINNTTHYESECLPKEKTCNLLIVGRDLSYHKTKFVEVLQFPLTRTRRFSSMFSAFILCSF
jgi:hypothetical protein